ncbi:putative Myosin-IIIb [Hypsibius exemplaris]|uniref:non-specific serine/threonine protein kinase n=1 Tax=Hypsibius exemplaris TaxID=2072580 RepID=A0A1W0WQ46_HYPEX|nr:putative Myosin-IIIb [Hypsibius exemplaris]
MDLLTKVVASNPHFIRCIKPNDQKLPNVCNREKIKQQLLYAGVLETARIRREGYSVRLIFKEFLKRYRMLVFAWEETLVPTAETCRTLLQMLKLEGWLMGRTKVFLKYFLMDHLSKLVTELTHAVTIVQAAVRGWLGRRHYLNYCRLRSHCAVIIQKVFRGYRIRKRYEQIRCERRIAMEIAHNKGNRKASRKRPCGSPLHNLFPVSRRSSTNEPSIGPPPRLLKFGEERLSKRLRDGKDLKPPAAVAPGAIPQPPKRCLNGAVKTTDAEGRKAGEDTPGNNAAPDSNNRGRVRDFVAVFEKGGTGQNGGCDRLSREAPHRMELELVNRSPSWKQGPMGFERTVPPTVPPTVQPTVQPTVPLTVQPTVSALLGKLGPVRPLDQPVPPSTYAPSSNGEPITVSPWIPEVAPRSDFRRVLRKSLFSAEDQTLSRHSVAPPLEQVDFRNVLRIHRDK